MELAKFYIIDALALIYRAHYAFFKNPMYNTQGINTSVIYGFTNSLLEILERKNPDYIAIAFDTPQPTFRHLEFKEYKSNREAQPELISDSIIYIKKIISAFGIPILEMPGFEADDIIGSLVNQISKKNFEIYIVTPDKDFGQLLKNNNIYLFKPRLGKKDLEILNKEEVKKKWNVRNINQIIDILGLWGDSVDCIPGVPGIGEKTAKKLISKYHSIENLINNVDELKGKIKENLIKFKNQALISKKLATINQNIDLNFNINKAKYKQFDNYKLFDIFKELEFHSIIKRLSKNFNNKTNQQSPILKEIENQKNDKLSKNFNDKIINFKYISVENFQELKDFYHKLKNVDKIGYKILINSNNPHKSNLIGIAIFYGSKNFHYLDFKKLKLDNDNIVFYLNKIFNELKILKVTDNIKNSLIIFNKNNIKINSSLFDIEIAHYLLNPDAKKDIQTIVKTYLNIDFDFEFTNNIDSKLILKTCQFAYINFLLGKNLNAELKELDFLKIYLDLEIPLAKTLAKIELNGVTLDLKLLDRLSFEIYNSSKEIENNIYQIAGEIFNISSPKQLGEILFNKLKISPNPQKTKTGQYATGENILSKISDPSGIIKFIIKYKTLLKLKTTYVDALPDLISKEDGKIHTTYNQIRVSTGRLSSNDPNLQNIPIKGKEGKKIRQAFIPRNKDFLILSADYSQIELRIIASFAKDRVLIDAFNNDDDIHTITACKIFNVQEQQVTKNMRDKAKTINYSIVYGISSFGLSQVLDIKRSEAKKLIVAYFENFSDIKIYFDKTIEKARKDGYVKTFLGKKRILDDINSRNTIVRKHAERNAINSPIQGTQAEMIKIAMIKIDNWMTENNLKSKMIMQVHDELVFDLHKDEVDIMKHNIKSYMENALKLDVPIKVNIKTGKNWLDIS